MRPAALGLMLLAWSGFASARTPFEASCEAAARDAGATFATRESGWRVDNTVSYRDLTRMKRPGVRNGYVLGLTRTESRVAIQVDGTLLTAPDGTAECVMPRVAVTLYYQPIVVYVSREFEPDSCTYDEILAHEMRHLKSYLDYLPKVEERVRARLGGRFAGKPLYARTGESRTLLQREIDRNWMPYIKAEMGRVERLQAAIDSPAEYARLSKVCQGEVQSLIGSTRRSRS
ncbi:hypothetical protein ACL58G_14100 [Massilia sp. GER05]|uniref:hypothetical protein n=1 Tax=Massilia sp. GER05 TaxID=3394605 RepID=UPI003F85AA54